MSFSCLVRTGMDLVKSQGDLLFGLLLGKLSSSLATRAHRTLGSSVPPTGVARLVTQRSLVQMTQDGAALDGPVPGTWAKYAIPKGLPLEEGERRMAIENQPHRVEERSFVIEEGYGKGTKRLIYSGTATVKLEGEIRMGRVAIHLHDADRAGLHYDLVCEGVPEGAERWELAIHNGPFQGRYAFVDASGAMSSGYNEGRLVTRMKDRGIRLDKPDYLLKDPDFLEEIRTDPNYVIARKYDGAQVNANLEKSHIYLRSHRETGETYYSRFPHIEFPENKSRLITCRSFFPAPEVNAVFQGELVHRDGAARVAGLCNSMPDKAQAYQKEHGKAELYVWDIKSYKGKDVSQLPYHDRRALCQRLVDELRPYCPEIRLSEEVTASRGPEFYEAVLNDARGLPFSEGVVVKDLRDPSGITWPKIKGKDLLDFELVEVCPAGPGKYENSAGSLIVRDPKTGELGKVGSFKVSDLKRQALWNHRDELRGAVVRVECMEKTERGVPRAGRYVGFADFHPDKNGYNPAIGELQLAA